MSNVLSRRRHLRNNGLLVAGAFVLSAAMGLVRNIIIARQFGIGIDLDAYTAAFKLPDFLFTIVAGGALATAFIPLFTQHLAEEDRAGAWRLASAITNIVVLVIIVCAGIAMLFAPVLVRTLIAPGFSASQQAETVTLMRIVLVSTLFFGVSAVQSSVLHGFKHFLLPALAPVVYPLGIIAGALWLAPTMGTRGLAIGAVIGALLHLAVNVPLLLRLGFRWQPVLDLKGERVRHVLWLMGPRVLDLGVFHIVMLATTNFASRLGAGSVSALEWGWEVMQLPETIIGTALGLVIFPTFADLAARGDQQGLVETLGDALQTLFFLMAPAAVALILLGRPLLEIVYQRGAFDASATRAVYLALSMYALGLPAHGALEVVARAFFAQKDTLTPLFVAAATGLFNLILAWLLMGPLAHGGLALANSLAVSLEVICLLWLLRRRWGLHSDSAIRLSILTTIGRVLAGSAAMTLTIVALQATFPSSPLLLVLSGGALGALVYLGVTHFLGLPWLHQLRNV